jgi:hypothetical protein
VFAQKFTLHFTLSNSTEDSIFSYSLIHIADFVFYNKFQKSTHSSVINFSAVANSIEQVAAAAAKGAHDK